MKIFGPSLRSLSALISRFKANHQVSTVVFHPFVRPVISNGNAYKNLSSMMLSDEEDTDYMSSLGSDDGSQEGGRGGGYILRPDSARRRPGRFREPEEIPFYQNIHPHDPTPYNPVIARFVDQITLPLDHAGPPPSVVKYEAHLRQLDLTHAEFQRQLEIGKGQDPPKANGNFSPFRSVSDGTSNGPTVVHLPPRAGRALTPASKEGEAQDETDQFNDGEVNEYQSNKNQALGNEAAEEPDDEFPADGREYLSNSDDSVSGSQDKIFMPRYQGDSGVAVSSFFFPLFSFSPFPPPHPRSRASSTTQLELTPHLLI